MAAPSNASARTVVAEHVGAPLMISFARVAEVTVTALRVVAGLLFMQHGVQKLFGLLLPPDQPFTGMPEAMSLMWTAGVLEVFGGALMVLGLFTRVVAFLLSGMMAVAYFMVHAKQGPWPILNQGELAVLYCFVWLAFAGAGAGPYSLDALIARGRGRSVGRYVRARNARAIETREQANARGTPARDRPERRQA